MSDRVSEFLAESKRVESTHEDVRRTWRESIEAWSGVPDVLFPERRDTGILLTLEAAPRMREALEAVLAWAERDLERAQPKYGEYAEGLRNAQSMVLGLIESALFPKEDDSE